MADTLNLEAEREAFEAVARQRYGKEHFEIFESFEGPCYSSVSLNGAWEGWLMARRSTSSVSEGEMPELPRVEWPAMSSDKHPYTADQMRDYGKACIRAATKAAAPADAPIHIEYDRIVQADERAMRAADALDGMGFTYDKEIGWLPPKREAIAAPAGADELPKLRERVAHLEAILDARLERKPDDSQEWAKVDGAIAFHLIERHADDWNDAGRMMDAWRDANPRRASSVPAIPGTGREKVRADALEEAAHHAECIGTDWLEADDAHKSYAADYIAKAIRGLAGAAPAHPGEEGKEK